MQSLNTILFKGVPCLYNDRQTHAINYFQIQDQGRDRPNNDGRISYNAILTLRSMNSISDLTLTYEDAYLLGWHLMRLGESKLSAHERMDVMKGLEDSKDDNPHA